MLPEKEKIEKQKLKSVGTQINCLSCRLILCEVKNDERRVYQFWRKRCRPFSIKTIEIDMEGILSSVIPMYKILIAQKSVVCVFFYWV